MQYRLLLPFCALFILSGCSRSFLISNGASDNRPLLFENEYQLSELKEVEVDGRAFFGIPSFSKNNKNNHTSGMLFYFNGIQLGRTPRILPIASLISMSLFAGKILNVAFPGERKYYYNSYGVPTYSNDRTGGIGIIP
ncbi:MAG: hypothetical protein ACKOW8_02425, partial [Flavobacteriales bacterium]